MFPMSNSQTNASREYTNKLTSGRSRSMSMSMSMMTCCEQDCAVVVDIDLISQEVAGIYGGLDGVGLRDCGSGCV